MSRRRLREFRRDFTAYRHDLRTTGPEVASRWGIDGTRHVSLENRSFADLVGVGMGDGRKKCSGVGMKRIREEVVFPCKFYYFAKIHDGYAVADVTDDAEIVRDENVRKGKPLLKIVE